MTTLSKKMTITEGIETDIISSSAPTGNVGFQKSATQTGFLVYSELPYTLWLRDSSTGAWESYQTFDSANLIVGNTCAWQDYDAGYIQTSNSGHVVRVYGRTTAIEVDMNLGDASTGPDTLVAGTTTTDLTYTTLQAPISSGQFKWSNWMGEAPGFQAGNMEYGGVAAYGEATQLTFHKEDADGVDRSAFLDQYLNAKSGQIKTILDANSGHHNVFQIVGASIDSNGNYKFDVYNVSHDDIAVTTGSTTVYFVLVGEQGAQGPAGVDGTSSSYVTSFSGPHSLGDDRDPGESLGAVTVDTGLSYQGGECIIVSMDARPDSFDIAQVTSYDSSTGEMHFNNIYQSTNDSDSTTWNINLSGPPGIQGPQGPQGPAGANGTSGDMGGTMTSHIIPDTNAAYDLGNAEYKIRHLFLSDNSMYIGDTWIKAEGDSVKMENLLVGDLNLNNTGRQNEVDGTSGHWSIQEGAEDLFLINRTTGKKYRFNITEVEE